MAKANSTPKQHRRGPNEGTITQRKDGRWEARLSLGGLKRKCYYGTTFEDVRKKLDKARNDLDSGIPIVTKQVRLETFLEKWLEDVIKPKVRLSTYLSYKQQVKVHITPILGRLRLTRLTAQHIEYYSTLKAVAAARKGAVTPQRA